MSLLVEDLVDGDTVAITRDSRDNKRLLLARNLSVAEATDDGTTAYCCPRSSSAGLQNRDALGLEFLLELEKEVVAGAQASN